MNESISNIESELSSMATQVASAIVPLHKINNIVMLI